MAQGSDYPVQLSVDYPESSNRLTVLFRIILAIPMIILGSLVSVVVFNLIWLKPPLPPLSIPTLSILILLLLLFRRKYPRWLFDFNLEVRRFLTRIVAYVGLLQDGYPSIDERQSVQLDIEYPDDLNRWLPLIKWILAIPHYIVLSVLGAISVVVIIVAWFAILFTGSYPRALFDFVVGVGRWFARVDAYVAMLATDEYPPFRLSP